MINPSAALKRKVQHMSEDDFKSYVLANGGGGARSTGQPREVAGTGAFVQLADVKCSSVVFNNTSGADFDIRRGATGTVLITVPDGAGKEFDVVENANELYANGASGSMQYECNGEEI